ncbi:MAG: proteasome assembly chaperone family protein [Candidatus Freyarchaeota archaeon]|nr:PAC2 family protein [Candidatus Freyrarchaeum guaymaensis]
MGVKFRFKKQEDFRGCVLITGFHSVIGETGYIAIRHIVKNLDFERVGFIETDLMPPFVWFEDGGLTLPFEIFKYERFVVVFPRVLPYRVEQREFAEAIVEWALREGVGRAVMIGGLDSRFKRGDEKFRVVATRAGYREALKLNAAFLEEGLSVFGPLALMLAYFELNDFPAIAILPFAERGRPDPRAAAVAVDILRSNYGLPVETESLIQDAKEIEEEIEKIIRQQEEREGEQRGEGMYI